MSARAWAGFLGLAVLWGIPYLFIKIAVDEGVPPVFLAWVRVAIGAALLLALAARAGTLGTVRGRGAWIAGYAAIEICIPFPLIGAGEQYVSSSLAAILIATVPAFVALLSLRFLPGERLTRGRAAGLLIGFAGVVALVGIDVAGDREELIGAGMILLAAFGYACGPMLYQRRFSGLDVRAAMGWALLAATVLLTPFALLDTPERLTPDAATAIGILGVACTAAAFALFAKLVTTIGAARTAIVTYVAPLVAVAAGVLALGEDVGPGALLGLVLILAGSWLATRPARRPVAPPPLPTPQSP